VLTDITNKNPNEIPFIQSLFIIPAALEVNAKNRDQLRLPPDCVLVCCSSNFPLDLPMITNHSAVPPTSANGPSAHAI
jgi:hypothetical protein